MPVDNVGRSVDNFLGFRVIHNLSTGRLRVIHSQNQEIVNTVNCGFAVYVTRITKLQSRNFTNVNKPVDNFFSGRALGKTVENSVIFGWLCTGGDCGRKRAPAPRMVLFRDAGARGRV